MAGGNILITGASSGIGRACAVRFGEAGYRVLAGVRNAAAANEIRSAGRNIEPVFLDVTNAESIQKAVEMVGGEPLAGLINNAGISAVGPLEMVPLEAWRRQFEVNVFGLVAVTQALLPNLRLAKGRVVNIGSIAGRSALPGTGAYDSSKFAVEAITDSLRMEVKPFGIHVSIVEPGAIATAIWGKTLQDSRVLNDRSEESIRQLYEPLLNNIRAETEKAASKALPVEAVVHAVEHAMTAHKPKTRYVIGNDARLFLLLNLLPDKWRDWLILNELNK